jgi:hypothetical protein
VNEPAIKQEAYGVYEISLVPIEQMPLIWSQVEEFLKKSAKRSGGRTRVEDIYYDLINNQSQLWIIFDTGNLKINGVQITLFNDYPTGKRMLNLEHTSGKNMQDWVEKGKLYIAQTYLNTLSRILNDYCNVVRLNHYKDILHMAVKD